MKGKWLSLVTLGLVLTLAVTALAGCGGPVPATAQEASQVTINNQQEGIWVGGMGEVTVAPDIAVVRLGIVLQKVTVAEAQTEAAEAMSNVMKSLTDSGIAQKDIQTGSFSINQRTRWDDQQQMEVVIGYQVSNMVTVKMRDIAKIGTTIDTVVQAGGDLIRINGISFSVEDPTKYYEEARGKAMADAKKKAEQLAQLAGVKLGVPAFVAEGMQSSPVYSSYQMAMPVPAPMTVSAPTSISPGETKVILTVQVGYAIAQ